LRARGSLSQSEGDTLVPFVVSESVGPLRINGQLGVERRATVMGMYRVLRGDLEEGWAECELALRLDAQVPGGHSCRGLYLAQTGDIEGARREFEMVVGTTPGFLAEQARRQLDLLD
jgi:hypothetical protein